MRYSAFFICVLCFLLVTRTAFSQGPEPFQRNEHLAVLVSPDVRAKPLSQVLASWSAVARGGPALKAAGLLSGERVTVIARERPLRDVLQSVATLLGGEWKTDGADETDGSPASYTLTQSSRARAHEKELWNATVDRAQEPLMRLAGYTQQPASHWAKIRAEFTKGGPKPQDPLLTRGNLRYLSNASDRAMLQLVRTLTLRQRRDLVENERLFLAWSELTPRQRQLAQTNVLLADPRVQPEDDTLTDAAIRERVQENLVLRQQLGLTFSVNLDPVTFGILDLAAGSSSCADFLYSKGELYDKYLLPVRGNPYPAEQGEEQGKNASPSFPSSAGGLDLEKTPFPKSITINTGDTWQKTLERLSQRLAVPIFSDNYNGARGDVLSEPVAPIAAKNPTLAEGLDALCQAHGRLWWYANGALFFRSRTWFLQRRYEVPPAVLAQLSVQIRPSERVTAGALVTLSNLTVHQLMGLVGSAVAAASQNGPPPAAITDRLSAPDASRAVLPFLQFFRSLAEDQKQAVLSADGLPYEQMTPAQQQQYARLCLFSLGRMALGQSRVFRIESGKSFPVSPDQTVYAVPAPIFYMQGVIIPFTVPYFPRETKSPVAANP